MGMSSVMGIAKRHVKTLYNYRKEKISARAIFGQFVAPLILGVAVVLCGWRLTEPLLVIVSAGTVAIAAAIMVATVASWRPRAEGDRRLVDQDYRLMNEFGHSAMWAITVSFILILVMVIGWAGGAFGGEGMNIVFSALVVAIGWHLVFVMGMCFKRWHRIYERVITKIG